MLDAKPPAPQSTVPYVIICVQKQNSSTFLDKILPYVIVALLTVLSKMHQFSHKVNV